MTSLYVCETFESLQGESSFAGMPCFFIRLAGCNLRCAYCDTPYALGEGRKTAADELAAAALASACPIIEITGGEPLLQPAFRELAEALRRGTNRPILVETNGSLDISAIPEGVTAVMDVKCPGSGQSEAFDWANIRRLRPHDEVKFVLCGRADYEWALEVLRHFRLNEMCAAVFFSPCRDVLDGRTLAQWMLQDMPAARLQPGLHRLLGLK